MPSSGVQTRSEEHRLNSSHGSISYAVSLDRKSTRLNSSHGSISYAVFCLKKKNKKAASHGHALCSSTPILFGRRVAPQVRGARWLLHLLVSLAAVLPAFVFFF